MRILNAPYDESGPRAEESLLEVLAGAARRKSDGALAVWTGVGALLAVAIGVALPRLWALLPLAIGASAFGAWGIVDRELGELSRAGATPDTTPGTTDDAAHDAAGRRGRILRVARAAIAVIGFAAGVTAMLLLFAAALGTWIS